VSILLYNLFLALYKFGIRLTARRGNKSQQWLDGRKDIFTHIAQNLRPRDGTRVWIHCASLGEFEQGRPIIEALKQQGYCIVLTFFSPSGYEIRKNYEQADYVFYLPLDHPKESQQMVQLINPSLVLFVKYEFWYYYLQALQQRGIPTLLVAAAFRPSQPFFKWYGGLFRKMLSCYTHLFVQDEASKNLLLSIHNNYPVIVAGDTRYDRVAAIAGQAKTNTWVEKWKKNQPVWVAGSTWPDDEKVLYAFCQKSNTPYKLIIAPHEVDDTHVQQLVSLFGEKAVRYSQFTDADIDKKVLLVDNMGMLSSLYQYGTIAYVGGGFAKSGIHNILEPAVFGLPVFFGPHFQKFIEAREMTARGLAFSISDANGLQQGFESIAHSEEKRLALKKEIIAFMQSKQGATDIIVKKSLELLSH